MTDYLPAVPERGAPVSADDVVRIERQVAVGVAHVDDVKLLDEWRKRARALEAYLRDKELQRPMLGAQRRAEARIGQLLGDAPGQGARTDRTLGHDLKFIPPDDRVDFRILARGFDGAALSDEEWRKSRRALISLIRQRVGLVPPTPPLPDGQYRVVVADPPWKLDTGPGFGSTIESGHDALAYEQMSLEDIKELPVEKHAAADAHLYLWTTNRYVEHAYDVARAWDFKPSVLLVWAKNPRGVGLGDAFRLTTEFVVYARRGSLKEQRIVETTWFNWPRGRHSAKPKEFYDLVESVSPAPYGADDRLEMFARTARPGWTVWGHEAPE